jgi:dihydroflavonol-4-reductase
MNKNFEMNHMKVFIVGGTGFLGYYATLEFLRRGHSVSTLSIPDVELGSWFPKDVKVDYGDIFKMSRDELVKVFQGFDAMVYAVGPDDRVTPKAPAYQFFHERLVEACTRVVVGARDAGVKRCVILNSYFAYFDRLWPDKHLADHHPYIKCRVEQAASTIEAGAGAASGKMDVMILELPYIFGLMPGRVPLWKDILVARLEKMNPVMYTTGGTNMISVEHVGEAIVGAIENGKHGERYPIGDENISWKEMLRIFLKAMGTPLKKIVTIPAFLGALYGKKQMKDDAKEGKEAGLNHKKLFKDIQAKFLYFDPTPSVLALKYKLGGIRESIEKTIRACVVPKQLIK